MYIHLWADQVFGEETLLFMFCFADDISEALSLLLRGAVCDFKIQFLYLL